MNFIKSNFWTIIKITLVVFLVYWLMFILTPSVKMSEESQAKIDSLNANIKRYEEENKKLDSAIVKYTEKITEIDSAIYNIKKQKTIYSILKIL